MKIGILTFHNADNYGAVLQCYALQEHLKKIYPNDEVCVIDYRNPLIERSYRILGFRRKILFNLTQFLYLPQVLKKRNSFRKFRKEFINVGSPDLSQYDAIYYGSDQIWNPNLTNNDMTYFGADFSGRKIAYAASDGGELVVTENIKVLLNGFESISCREKSLSEKLQKENVSVPIEVAKDPVFLLSKDEWLNIAQKPRERGYVLAYKITENPSFDKEAEYLGKKLGKPVIQIVYTKSARRFFYKKQKFVSGISPEQFVGYIANADFVLTTSFHGTAFSIIFDKPFYVLSFEKRSERITDLLLKSNKLDQWIDKIS